MSSKKRKGKRRPDSGKSMLLYCEMRVEEDFEKAAQRAFAILREAVRVDPRKRRFLAIGVQGHRNPDGSFDHDAFDFMGNFTLKYLSPYVDEISTPLYRVASRKGRRNDVPDVLYIVDPDSEHEYDHQALDARARERDPDVRSSRPSVKAIAAYLDADEVCLICWGSPVERAHVVPKSLGGSNDVRNFALLCTKHHKEAPDVADAEAFWSWVDYACDRDGHEKWSNVDPELLKKVGINPAPPAGERSVVGHWLAVKTELVEHYGWSAEDFSSASLDELMGEFHVVLENATTTHFGIAKKVSTEAWAFEIARRRIADR